MLLVGRRIAPGLSTRKAAVSDAPHSAGTKASFLATLGKLFVPATPSLWKNKFSEIKFTKFQKINLKQ